LNVIIISIFFPFLEIFICGGRVQGGQVPPCPYLFPFTRSMIAMYVFVPIRPAAPFLYRVSCFGSLPGKGVFRHDRQSSLLANLPRPQSISFIRFNICVDSRASITGTHLISFPFLIVCLVAISQSSFSGIKKGSTHLTWRPQR